MAPTFEDGWATCVEGPSGILAALGTNAGDVKQRNSPLVSHWNRSWGELRFRSGHLIRVASADDGGLRIQGKNLKGAWADEIGLWDKWQTAWMESLGYAVRLGKAQIVVTGTPKASRKAKALVKMLLDDPSVPVRRLRTQDNAENLSESFFNEVVGRAKGTRLERQELEGELLEDIEGALWNADVIDRNRVQYKDVPDLDRIVVAIDPAVSANENSDESGIIVVGEKNGHGYVLADYSRVASPNLVMERVVRAFYDHEADCIVGEVNNGGDYIGTLLRTVDPNVPYKVVHATRGKALRAEPVSALYEQNRVHHVGMLTELEDQMVSWAPGMPNSPDRLDACIAKGSPILTHDGEIAIECVRIGDRVWTRAGWRRVLVTQLTRRDAQVVHVELSNGKVLIGTPDHRILLEDGAWIRLDALVCGDSLSGWINHQTRSHSRVSATDAIPGVASEPIGSTISHHEAAGATTCIGMSGVMRIPASTFPMDGTSITSTTIHSTTTPATSPFSRQSSMRANMRMSSESSGSNGPIPYARLQPNGMAQKLDSRGTGSMESALGRIANPSISGSASPAGRHSMHGSSVRDTALGLASTGQTISPSAMRTRSPAPSAEQSSGRTSIASSPRPAAVSVVRSYASSEPIDVYDLMVEDQHEFVACGVIVHNCVWAITELHSLSTGDWYGAYGIVECYECGHKYMGEIHDRCPKCAAPKL